MEDKDIVSLFWRRDEQALAETAARLDGYCLAIARGVLGDEEDARECVNDAYLAAWNAIPPHRPENLAPFLGKLTRRIAVNALEKRDAAKRGGGQGDAVLEELAECLPGGEDLPAGEIEIILALSGDVEGETTSLYIYRQIENKGVKVSTLARGLGFGDDLEYADALTLGRSLVARQPFKP